MFEKLNYNFKIADYYIDNFYIGRESYARKFESEVNDSLQNEECSAMITVEDIKYYSYQDESDEDVRDGVKFNFEKVIYDFENHSNTVSFIIDKFEFKQKKENFNNLMNSLIAEDYVPTIRVLMRSCRYPMQILDAMASSISIEQYDYGRLKLTFTAFRMDIDI